jgi:uncharacterized membrane protein YccC
VAFTFDLDQPQWTLLTVFVVAQPQSDGMILAKSFYRILGTVVGAAVALLFVGLFAQERVLFLGALACWVGLCTFGSQYARNWTGYGFVLSGYTVAIVGIPGALQPSQAFYIATARITEISLGIVFTAGIGHLILPDRVSSRLLDAVSSARVDLANATLALLRGEESQSLRTKLLAQAIACENLAAAAAFEDAELRRRRGYLRDFNLLLIRAGSLLQLLEGQPGALARNCTGARCAIERAARAVADWRDAACGPGRLSARLQAAASELPSAMQIYHRAAEDGLELAAVVAFVGNLEELLTIVADSASAYDVLLQGGAERTGSIRFARSQDGLGAALTSVRAIFAVGIVAFFWIITAWPNGSTAAILATVATARLATMGHAVPIARAGTLIFSLAAVPAFVVVEVLLPLASGFVMFAVIVAPLIFGCALLIANPRTQLIGFLSGLLFASVGLFQNRMAYDAAGLINTSIAAVLAAAVAMVLWAVVAPETGAAARRRFRRAVRRVFVRITAPGSNLASAAAEAELSEALDQLRGQLRPDVPVDMAAFEAGLAAVSAGRALIRVREQPRIARSGPVPELALPRLGHQRAREWYQAVRRMTDLIIAGSMSDLVLCPRTREGCEAIAARMCAGLNLRKSVEAARLVAAEDWDNEVRHAT